ncbi:hypothetical protein [Kribbella amoyensis]|uniref:hypothetical protein n=1 Tax=Kribbella amoyensis TaxID=996641 RepID=UPI00192D71B7|nr:hypothetical protein [Kribbella amoyensis]
MAPARASPPSPAACPPSTGEGFGLIVDDLLRLPAVPTVVEGFRLLPELVEPLLTDRLTSTTARLGLQGVPVEVGTTEDELTKRVTGLFSL